MSQLDEDLSVISEWFYYSQYFLNTFRCIKKASLIRTNVDSSVVSDKFLIKLNSLLIKQYNGRVTIDIVEFDRTNTNGFLDLQINRFFDDDDPYKVVVIVYYNEKQIFGVVNKNRILFYGWKKPKSLNYNLYKPIFLDMLNDTLELIQNDYSHVLKFGLMPN